MIRGSALTVEGPVDGTFDAPKKTGYGVHKEITIEGTPGESVVLEGLWDSIKAAGDLPVWVSVTLTWSGQKWPWTKVVSEFDVQYQAVHMAEGSILATVVAAILYALPYLAKILLILLGWRVVNYTILKVEDVAAWLDEQGPAVGAGLGIGMFILVALILSGDKK